MFIRTTTYEFQPGREGDIAAWVDTKTEEVRAVPGLIAVDVFNADPGRGVIVASYEDQDSYEAAAGTIGGILGELASFLSAPPMTAAGTTFWTTRLGEETSV